MPPTTTDTIPPAPARRVRGRLLAIAIAAAGAVALAGLTACEPSPWTTTYEDDFVGSSLDRRWARYTGSPSSDPYASWASARARVAGGSLVLDAQPVAGRSGHWTTGGVSNWRNAQTFGRWTIRFRAPKSSIMSFHFLLWPASDRWPPEIDIVEGWDPERREAGGFLHWIDQSNQRRRESFWTRGDFSTWNTAQVTWTPGELIYTMNGVEWGRVTGPAVPSEPMWLALQTETQACDRARSSCAADTFGGTPRVEIDRVLVEAYSP